MKTFFENSNIGRKILTIPALCIVSFLIIAAFFYYSNNTTFQSLERANKAGETLTDIRQAEAKLVASNMAILLAFLRQIEGQSEDVVQQSVEQSKADAKVVSDILVVNETDILKIGVEPDDYYLALFYQEKFSTSLVDVVEMLAVDTDTAIMVLNGAIWEYEALQALFLKMISTAEAGNQQTVESLKNTLNTNLFSVMVIIVLFIVLLLAAGVIIGGAIAKPIQNLTSVMTNLASGELSVDIPDAHRRDEVGHMAKTVQVFKDSLIQSKELEAKQREQQQADSERATKLADIVKNFEGVVTQVVESFSQSSQNMQTAAESLGASVRTSESTTDNVNIASGQAMANVETVAAAVQEMTASIQDISQQINNTMSIVANAVEQASTASNETERLVEAADKIGDVVGLIQDIAEQTNLLALNATIESARAGDAGKGFAVVASEVKELASQTSQATEEIARTISEVQDMSSSVTNAIENIRKSIDEVNNYSTTVAAAIEEQSNVTNDISANMQQAAQGVGDISSNMNDVIAAVAEVKNVAENVSNTSNDLSTHTGTLNAEVSTFCNEINKC